MYVPCVKAFFKNILGTWTVTFSVMFSSILASVTYTYTCTFFLLVLVENKIIFFVFKFIIFFFFLNATFTRKDNLDRHMKIHNGLLFSCEGCDAKITRKYNYSRNAKTMYGMYFFYLFIIILSLRVPFFFYNTSIHFVCGRRGTYAKLFKSFFIGKLHFL